MAYLDDYPHLHALQQKYGVSNAPIEELREAARADGYENCDEMVYAPKDDTPPRRKRKSKFKGIRPARRLAIFETLGISSTSSGSARSGDPN